VKTTALTLDGVFAVPPLARRSDPRRTIDPDENLRIVRHIVSGGITRLLYGGNAFLYHITLSEYAELLHWLGSLPDDVWPIPSLGPSYGRAMDQAAILRKYRFPCGMLLPCHDPRDAAGLERGARDIAEATGTPLIIYVKEESDFGADRDAGLDAVGRLVRDGVCMAIKYAIVRPDPNDDPYLQGLLARVERRFVISGMGERPAVQHMRDWQLTGFTTGSGCLAPASCQALFDAARRGAWADAEALRERFMPLEDLRDAWGPARVLHAATALAGIAQTGPIPPYVTELDGLQRSNLSPAATELMVAEMSTRHLRTSAGV